MHFRLLLNEISTIHINVIDQDNDIVLCEKAGIGTSNGIDTPKGLNVNTVDLIF